jgi:hypothetical protein
MLRICKILAKLADAKCRVCLSVRKQPTKSVKLKLLIKVQLPKPKDCYYTRSCGEISSLLLTFPFIVTLREAQTEI